MRKRAKIKAADVLEYANGLRIKDYEHEDFLRYCYYNRFLPFRT